MGSGIEQFFYQGGTNESMQMDFSAG